jgi:hypothetical protein
MLHDATARGDQSLCKRHLESNLETKLHYSLADFRFI